MSLNKSKSFRTTAAIVTAASMLFGVSSLSAYEEKWNDKKAGDPVEKDGEKVPNSLFRVDGEIWGAYEMADKKPSGEIDTSNGFRVGRTYVNIRGDVKEGEMKGWGYRITLDSATGEARETSSVSTSTACNNHTFTDNDTGGGDATETLTHSCSSTSSVSKTGAPGIFLKYAYIQAPIAKGTFLRIGQQHIPTVDGQAGTSLQSIWGHRYLDDDGKAMWEELGVNSSTDLGVALIHQNKMFNVHLLLANGESYKSSGNGNGLSSKGQTSLSTVANGDSKSYGLDLYGMLSLTPFAKDEKDKGLLTIAFPFRFQNVIGVQRKEYDNVTAFDPVANTFTAISGQKRALQDYAYGTEVDLHFKTDIMKLTVGAGTVIKVDRRSDALLFNQSMGTLDPSNNVDLDTFFTTNYARASDSRGQANYMFAHASFGKFGLVGRYSTGTGTGSLDEKIGVADGVSTAERLLIDDIKAGNGIDGNLSTTALRNFDQGRARFTKALFGVTYSPNARFSATLGLSHITGQAGSGDSYTANKLQAINSYTTDRLAGVVAPGTIVTDNDLLGEKNYDRQTFIRMVYHY